MIGTILLARDNSYCIDGNLPKRPEFDKSFLRKCVRGNCVSIKGMSLLPPSIQSELGVTPFPIAISELGKSDVLLVVRSSDPGGGSKFDLSDFKRIEGVEIWVRNN